MGSGGKGGTRTVYDFLLSVDYGLCHGPVDSINEIIIKDESAFVGPITDSGQAVLFDPELFGGDDAEGGPVGTVEFYLGEPDQTMSEHLAARFDAAPADEAGYRGLAHVFFRGESGLSEGGEDAPEYAASFWKYIWGTMLGVAQYAGVKFGFKWTSNNPYFPAVAFRATRVAKGLGGFSVYPVDGITNPYGTEADPYVNPYPSFDDLVTSTDGYTSSVVSDTIHPRFFAGPGWPTANLNIQTSPRVGDFNQNQNTAIGKLIVDVDISGVTFGDTIFYTDSVGVDANTALAAGSVDLAIYAYTAEQQEFLDTGGASGLPGRTLVASDTTTTPNYLAEQDRTVSFVKNADYTLMRMEQNIDGAFWVPAGGAYAFTYFRDPELQYTNPIDFLTAQWSVAEETDAFNAGVLDPTLLPDANPAEMIYECMTNTVWGKGDPVEAMDTDSYLACATRLNELNFGLSMAFFEQDSVEAFVSEILDHIQAVQYIDRRTGLWTLKLLEGDYTVSELPLFDESNCTLETFRARTYAETINEIIVEYTDPVSEELETVSAKRPSNVAIQGGVVSETRTYYGIRNPYLAQYVAERDVAEVSVPLTGVVLAANREAEDIQIGDVIRFSWAEEGVTEMVLRVQNVEYGSDNNRAVILDCTQDVHSFPRTDSFQVREPKIPNDQEFPQQMEYAFALTPPLPPMIRGGFDVEAFDAEYPQSHLFFLAYDPDFSPISIEAWADSVLPNNTTGPALRTTFVKTGRATLLSELTPEVRSTIAASVVENVLRGPGSVGNLLMIGSSEAESEVIMLDSYDAGSSTWTVLRGLYDTTPDPWPAGTEVWRLSTATGQVDLSDMVPGSPVTYRILPRSPGGIMAYDDAQTVVGTPSERLYRPFRPANVQIGGNGFGTARYTGTIPATVPLTWATRNRKDEDTAAEPWDEASVTPETGQTTTVRVTDETGAERILATGLTGSSYDIDTTVLTDYRFYTVEVWSERDGLESLRRVSRLLDLERTGYGNNYGYDYGENDGE